jgi:hypothetical protein
MNRNVILVLLASTATAALTAAFSLLLAPLVLALALLVLSPLMRQKRIWFVGDVESEFRIISRRREEALRGLKDLEEDRLAGKTTEEEYEQLRPAMLQAAKDLTRQLDTLAARRAEARKRIEDELARAAARK